MSPASCRAGPIWPIAVAAWAIALLPAGCGPDAPPQRPLHVFAASSLTDAFADLAAAFETAHPDADVVLAFAGSHVLRLQIEQGAPADVFATADPRHMDALSRAGLVTEQRLLAANELVVIVPPDNPAQIDAFVDLAQAQSLVIGTPRAPVGAYAREVLMRAEAAGGPRGFAAAVLARVVSEESNARLLRAKVEMGEADAAIVYRTDALRSRVASVPVPDRANVRARYRIGVVTGATNVSGGRQWVGFAASPQGRRILSRHGFLTEIAKPVQ